MINIVMLVCNRPELTRQSLDTLFRNTRGGFMVTIVDDASDQPTVDVLKKYPVQVVRVDDGLHVTAKLRNYGVAVARRTYPTTDWLYLADNDSFFTPYWNTKMIAAYERLKPHRFLLLGGQNHHYHQPIAEYDNVAEYSTLAGTSQLMKWATWDKYGPLVETGRAGPCNGEDHEFAQLIINDGAKVGAMMPPVVYDCGITQTGGTPSPGAETKHRYDGVMYE